ncbi:Protein SGT1 A [Dissophora ornata]|nr:Protein SGT1 A [Dissophora ornata]
MNTVQDLFAQGSHSFADEDYDEALSYYSKAININATHAEIFLKRSATYQKLGKDKEAYEDAIRALALIQEKPLVEASVEAKAQLRKGVAAYHLQDYQTAKDALEACQALSPEQRTLASWIRKNEQELAKLTKSVPAPVSTSTSATVADVTPASSPVTSHASPASTPVPAPLTPSAHRVRHEWFQSETYVTISVFIKNAKKDAVDVNITENALSVSVKMPTGSDYSLEMDPLSHKIIPTESKFEVLSTKIEIRLKKEFEGLKWGALEGDDVNAASMASVTAGAAPAYPTSSKKTKDWDTLEKQAAKEEEKADGDKALNQLFAQIYKDADDDARRAMMKSFTESNGTCLSTNWDEVGKGTVETRPPEGMVAKKAINSSFKHNIYHEHRIATS